MSDKDLYAVTLRGTATQTVYVRADSKSEARDKATAGDFVDSEGYPDWYQTPDGEWSRRPARQRVERIEREQSYWNAREEA